MKKRGITEIPPNPHRKGPPNPAAQYRRDGEGIESDGPTKMSPSLGRIRIVLTPPGFAPENIRKEWIGVEIPLVTQEQLDEDPPVGRIGNENVGGYVVLLSAAVTALRKAGKQEAADFWDSLSIGTYLEFKRDVCERVS